MRELSYHPRLYRVRQDISESDLEALMSEPRVRVIDPIDTMSNDIFESRYPSERNNQPLRESFLRHMGRQGLEAGVWVYTDWNSILQRYPDKEDYFDLRLSRNRHLIKESEQKALYGKTVVHGGLSVGGVVNNMLVQAGIGNKRVLIDPDTVNYTGLNRTVYRNEHIGLPKTVATARMNVEHDPYGDNIVISGKFDDTPQVIGALEAAEPDIFIEEMDNIEAKAKAREFCRRNKIPLVMGGDIGDIAVVDVERHDIDRNVKPFNGRLTDDEMRDVASNFNRMGLAERQRYLAKIAGSKHVLSQPRMMESAMQMDIDIGGIPQLNTTASLAAALTSVATREILLGNDIPSGVYHFNARKHVGARRRGELSERVATLPGFIKFIRRK